MITKRQIIGDSVENRIHTTDVAVNFQRAALVRPRTPREKMMQKADLFPFLVLRKKEWELSKYEEYPNSSRTIAIQTFLPRTSNVKLTAVYDLEKEHVELTVMGCDVCGEYVLHTETFSLENFSPSHLSRMLKTLRGKNVVIRYYPEIYHSTPLASTILDTLVEALEAHLAYAMIRVVDLAGPVYQVEIKGFTEREIRYILRINGSVITTHFIARDPLRKERRWPLRWPLTPNNGVTSQYEELPRLDLSDPSIDPETAIRELAQQVKV